MGTHHLTEFKDSGPQIEYQKTSSRRGDFLLWISTSDNIFIEYLARNSAFSNMLSRELGLCPSVLSVSVSMTYI